MLHFAYCLNKHYYPTYYNILRSRYNNNYNSNYLQIDIFHYMMQETSGKVTVHVIHWGQLSTLSVIVQHVLNIIID